MPQALDRPSSGLHVRSIRRRGPRLVLAEGMRGSRHQSGIVAFGDQRRKQFHGSRVTRLKTQLMDRDATHSWAQIMAHAIDQRPHDVERQRANFTPLASDRVDGVSAHQRRDVVKCLCERFATSLVSQVIHEGDAGRPNVRTPVRRPSDQRCDGPRSGTEQVIKGLLANAPDVGLESLKVAIVVRVHGCILVPNAGAARRQASG